MKEKRSGGAKTLLPASSPIVSAAQAKTKFADLLRLVEAGGTVTIERYNKAVAKIVPAGDPPKREFGFWDGRVKFNPDWNKEPLFTEEEIDAFVAGNLK